LKKKIYRTTIIKILKATMSSTHKRSRRLASKLAKWLETLPVDQQSEEISKLRTLRPLIKEKIQRKRSSRHYKRNRRERPVEPIGNTETEYYAYPHLMEMFTGTEDDLKERRICREFAVKVDGEWVVREEYLDYTHLLGYDAVALLVDNYYWRISPERIWTGRAFR
jgi:hypothetical protein